MRRDRGERVVRRGKRIEEEEILLHFRFRCDNYSRDRIDETKRGKSSNCLESEDIRAHARTLHMHARTRAKRPRTHTHAHTHKKTKRDDGKRTPTTKATQGADE